MSNEKTLTFSNIKVGDTFEFESVHTFPHSGMMRGPWVKLSMRKYFLKDNRKFVCKVGTVKTKVFIVE